MAEEGTADTPSVQAQDTPMTEQGVTGTYLFSTSFLEIILTEMVL